MGLVRHGIGRDLQKTLRRGPITMALVSQQNLSKKGAIRAVGVSRLARGPDSAPGRPGTARLKLLGQIWPELAVNRQNVLFHPFNAGHEICADCRGAKACGHGASVLREQGCKLSVLLCDSSERSCAGVVPLTHRG